MKSSFVTLLCILVFHSSFVPIDLEGMERYMQVILSLLVLTVLLLRTKLHFTKQYKSINIFVYLFIFSLLITSWLSISLDISKFNNLATNLYSRYYTNRSIYEGISFALRTLVLFYFIQFINSINKIEILVRCFFICSLIYVVIQSFLLFFNGISDDGTGYFLGNKFTVIYFFLLSLLFYKYYLSLSVTFKNKRFLLYLLFVAIISLIIQCTTGLFACVIILLLHKYKNIFFKYMATPLKIVMLLLICDSFFFIFSNITNIPLIKFILLELGEDPTLTGRMVIYSYLYSVLQINPLWGIGIGNSSSLLLYLFGFHNAQNGAINVIIEQGIIGLIFLMLLLISVIKYARKYVNSACYYPALSMLIMYIILSSVEITLGSNFVFIMPFLLIKSLSNK